MTEPTKRPTGAAVAAALSPFLGLPLTIVFLLLAVGFGGSSEYETPFSRVSQAWLEGGWGMYLVLGVGGLLSLVAAIFMFFGVQRGSVTVLANAPLASALVAVGAFGYWQGMSGAFAAVAYASPSDRATIIAGSMGEALNTTLLGLCAMAGLLAALCLGTLLGVLAQEGVARRLLLAATGVFGSLVIVAGVFGARLRELMASFKALAHVSPLDRLTIMTGVGEELGRYRVMLLGALVLVLVMAVLGAVLVKAVPRLAVMVPLMGLAGLFGFGTQELARKALDGVGAGALSGSPSLGLIELKGQISIEPRWCARGTTIVDCGAFAAGTAVDDDALADELATNLRQFRELNSYAETPSIPEVPLGLATDADSRRLWDFIGLAGRAGFTRILLIGESAEHQPRSLPSELEALARAMETPFRGVPLALRTVSEGCARSCVAATVKGETLVVGKDSWEPGPVSSASLEEDVAIAADPTMTPKTLTRLALAAAAHQHRLALLVADDALGSRENTEDDLEPSLGGGLGQGVPLGGLGSGDEPEDVDDPAEPPPAEEPAGLTGDEIAKVVKGHLSEIRGCYEAALRRDPNLAGKVVLRWAVTPAGTVSNIEVTQDTLGESTAVDCIKAKPVKWKFPKPKTKREVIVSYPFSFKPAN